MLQETRRLLEAATALHSLLLAAGVPHAFHGDFVVAVFANAPLCNVGYLPPFNLLRTPLTLGPGNILHRRGRNHSPLPSRSTSMCIKRRHVN